jgi:hypothetical protein
MHIFLVVYCRPASTVHNIKITGIENTAFFSDLHIHPKLSLYMSVELLQQELLERWLTAYDEISLLENYQDQAVSTVYAESVRFDLETYTKDHFPPGKPLLTVPPLGEYFSWGLAADGKPCYYNGRNIWKGFYTYSDELAEYLEFSPFTGIPTSIKRIAYDGNRKISYQSFGLNGITGYGEEAGTSKEDKLATLMNDSFSVMCSVEQYHYEGERIIRADCLEILFGEQNYSTNEYTYTSSGELYEIVSVRADGRRVCLYAKPVEDIPLETLGEEVAGLMAADIIDTLIAYEVETPLAVLEINYHSQDVYMPMLRTVSLTDWNNYAAENGEEDLFASLMLGGESDYMNVTATSADHLFTAFINRVDAQDDFKPAEAMIRKVAVLLTQGLAKSRMAVTAHFVAYAADWTLGGREFDELLIECGAPEAQVEDWKERGII